MIFAYPKFVRVAAGRQQRLKAAILACFNRPSADVEARLYEFQLGDWEKILFWLDISGLALYLLDQLTQFDLTNCLPEPILLRLRQDLVENRKRSKDLLREAAAIGSEMESQGVSFAILKGITLTPESVPDAALRWQIDLDYLVAAPQAEAASKILYDFGYSLNAVSGSTLEFKAGKQEKPDIRNIYRVHPQRAIELHLLSPSGDGLGRKDRLSRAIRRPFNGAMLPSLSPADIFVQQGIHLFKHLCGEHTRASWVLEFWRHAQSRNDDDTFWKEVEAIVAHDQQAELALGASISLATLTFGECAAERIKGWTADKLPPNVRRWIEEFGMRVLLAGTPGNKLYLILRRQLDRGESARLEVRRLVIPAHLPPPITRGEPGESLARRFGRFRIETVHLFARLRFHVWEGLRYGIEFARWQLRAPGATE